MFRKSVRMILLLGVVLSMLLFIGAAWAESQEASGDRGRSEARVLESDLRRKEGEIDQVAGRLVEVGTKLEDSQVRLDRARDRKKEIGRQSRKLNEALEVQEEATARSRSRLENQIQASYKGRDLTGILLLIEGLFGGSETQNGDLTALQATRLLTESSRSIQYYKDEKQDLKITLQQLEQSKVEYREFGQKSQTLVEELEERESELRDSVDGLDLQRDRMEKRLVELEAKEKAGLLKRPPATTSMNEPVVRRDPDVVRDEGTERDERQSREDGQGREDVPGPGEEQKEEEEREHVLGPEEEQKEEQARERELEISREEIATRPVEPIPYEAYVRLYKESAERYEFAGDWYVLAAVGKIESNHGENMGPSDAGAMGPMQFLPPTWISYGVDGNGDGEANIVDPEDAIPAAASYLKAGGAPDDWYAALFTYNRAGWYVEEVLAIAESYRRIHGDDTVGPYLETPPSQGAQASPSTGPAPRPEETPDEREEPQPERPVDDVPTDEEPEASNDGRDPDGETPIERGSTEPESPAAEDGATTEQYQY